MAPFDGWKVASEGPLTSGCQLRTWKADMTVIEQQNWEFRVLTLDHDRWFMVHGSETRVEYQLGFLTTRLIGPDRGSGMPRGLKPTSDYR